MENQKRGLKIISGGQTGVDRAALDAALESRYPLRRLVSERSEG